MKIAEFDIEVERKEIKNIHLAVYPPDGRVHISVPTSFNEDELGMYLYSKLPWIREQHAKVLSQNRQTPREYVTGESHYLLGNRYLLKVLTTSQKGYVQLSAKYIELYTRNGSSISRRQDLLEAFYRAELQNVLTKLIEKWSVEMEENASTFTWSILHMQNQWGSCKTHNRSIQFNLLLARVPIRCIEYIVVHELAHLKEHNHNQKFAQILDNYLPDWSSRKKELDEFVALPIK